MIELDTERLHRNVEKYLRGEHFSRREGKTLTMIHILIGSVEVAPPGSSFVVVAHDRYWQKTLNYQVMEVVKYFKIPLSVCKETEFVTTSGVHVMFVVVDDVLFGKLNGIRFLNFFLDDENVMENRYSHKKIDDVYQILCAHLEPKRQGE